MAQALLSNLKTFLILSLISLLLVVFDNLGILNFLKTPLQFITVPIQYGLYKTSLSVTNQFKFFIMARRASQENKALKEQIGKILSENAEIRKKLSETQAFLSQQKALNPQTFNLIPARPVGVSRLLYIDKGSSDSLKLNQVVIFNANFIGKIKEVSPKKSGVLLSTDPDSKISAFVEGLEGKARGVLLGQFGSEMLLDKVLHEEPLKKSDLVYSAGTEQDIPRGLILGQISEVIDKDNEIFKGAKVKPIFDIGDLDVVFIITDWLWVYISFY